MIESLRARLIICVLVNVIALAWIVPNFVDTSKMWWPSKDKISYGLDIQGGLHLGLEVDIDGAFRDQSAKQAASLKSGLKTEKNLDVNIEVVNPNFVHLKMTFNGPSAPVEEYLDTVYRNTMQVTNKAPGMVEVQYFEAYLSQFKKNLVEKAREVITNRIDEFGVAEPSITVQGTDRLIVQLPGIKDPESAKNLINQTAKLEFMIVDREVNLADVQKAIDDAEKKDGFSLGKNDLRYTGYVEKINAAIKDKLPKGRIVRFEKAPNAKNLEAGKIPYVLRTDAMLGGETLDNAYTTFDGQTNSPQVAFSFNGQGTKDFATLTTEHKGELMAIVLDGVVQSAPVIRTPITGGNGVIELGSGMGNQYQETLAEANVLSMVLRSGALPVAIQIVEERVVGPSLGADSVEKGQKAAIISFILIFIAVIAYYKMFGVIADITLVSNLILLLAALTSLRATLTLPGIAGIALTIGMAVDANIIIFERMRDELRKGASLAASVRDGFNRAFWTIFDANVTTLATCVVLLYFGTGPIRGFAVSLIIGLLISMFTSIFMTRAMIDLLVNKFKMKLSL